METKIGLAVETKVHTTDEINKLFLPGEMGCVLDWEVKDSITGELFEKKIKKAESFTRQFFDLLLCKFKGTYYQILTPIYDITSGGVTPKYVVNNNLMFNASAISGVVINGIIVGLNTGDPAATISDFVLTTPCGHDSGAHGANTFQYSAVTFGAPAADSTTSQFTITRNFANATAGTILVKEIGLYVIAGYLPDNIQSTPLSSGGITIALLSANFMILHDIIAGGISVLAGQTLTVNYRPQCVI